MGEPMRVKAKLERVQERKGQQASETTPIDNYLEQCYSKGNGKIRQWPKKKWDKERSFWGFFKVREKEKNKSHLCAT